MSRRLPWLAVESAIAFMQPTDVRAETVADFYKGKDITFIVSAGEGGGYAAYARTFAPYLGNALPGKPEDHSQAHARSWRHSCQPVLVQYGAARWIDDRSCSFRRTAGAGVRHQGGKI